MDVSMAAKQILISPGFGAGWSTWMDDEACKFALTYQPLIDDILRDGKPSKENLDAFVEEYVEKFGRQPYTGGARDLTVATVDGPFRIDEYDGSELIITSSDLMEL